MNMTAVEFDQEEEDINVDTDSRPGSPPVLQKPRISFSISALLGGDHKNNSTKSTKSSSIRSNNNNSSKLNLQKPNGHHTSSYHNPPIIRNHGGVTKYQEDNRAHLNSSPHSDDDPNDSHLDHEADDHDSSPENDEEDHDDTHDEDQYEEGSDYGFPTMGSRHGLVGGPTFPQSYFSQLGPNFTSLANSLQASGIPLHFNPHTVLRVPAHRPPLGYPQLGGLGGAPPPWVQHGIALSALDRSTALAPHFPSLDRLTGESFMCF